MASMKEEMERLRALADDRERLSMTAQSLEDRLKQRETEVRQMCLADTKDLLYFICVSVCVSFSQLQPRPTERRGRRGCVMCVCRNILSEPPGICFFSIFF